MAFLDPFVNADYVRERGRPTVDIRLGAIEAKEAIIREAEGLVRYEKFQDGYSKAQRLRQEFKEADYAGRGKNNELYRRFRTRHVLRAGQAQAG